MKVAFVTNLAEEVVARQNLLVEMISAGHEVTACVSRSSGAVAIGQARAITRCELVRLDRTGLNPVADAFYVRDLFRFFRQERPQVVLNRAVKPVIYGSIAARLAGTGAVFSLIAGLGAAFLSRGGVQRILSCVSPLLYRLALAGNERVLFQNPEDLSWFLDRRLLKNEQRAVLLNGAGVDLLRFQPVALPKNGPCFLFIGRLLKQKGVHEYVEAARRLKRKYPAVRFVLVGETDANPSSVSPAEAVEWARTGVLDWRGSVRDVRSAIGEASVLVLPSYREGSPRAVLEAMAMGRAVVTTDVPGCRDTVKDGVNGFLVQPGDPSALAGAMERFILQPDLIAAMGAQGRRIACERFDIKGVNAAILCTLGLLPSDVRNRPANSGSDRVDLAGAASTPDALSTRNPAAAARL